MTSAFGGNGPQQHFTLGTSMSRRRLLRLMAGAAIGAVGTGAWADGRREGNHLDVRRTDVFLPHWPQEADGLRIGLISDFHADYRCAVIRTHRSALLLAAQRPDLVFLGGDYVSRETDQAMLPATVAALAPLAHVGRGAYAILGNHDWWGENEELATHLLRQAGFNMLRNASVPIPGVSGAYIVGLDDGWLHRMDVERALRGVPRSARKLVALHEPDFADEIGEGFDLQLSGHSHGGQVRVPGLPALHVPKYARLYPEGLQRAKRHLVYTTRGVGMVGPQVRAFCPPEVTVLTVRVREG
jgi:hypothetical protein